MPELFSLLPADLATLLAEGLGTYLLHSTMLLGGVWIAMRVFDLSTPVQEALWKIGLVGALLTTAAQLTIGVTLVPPISVEAWGPSTESAPVPAETERRPAVSADPAAEISGASLDQAGADPSPARAERGPGWLPPASEAFILVWVLGAGLLGLRRFGQLYRLRARLRGRYVPRNPALIRLIGEVLWDRPGGPSAAVTLSPAVSGPLALTGREIVLPPRPLDRWSPDQLRAILAHELAHLWRRDPWWIGLGAAMEAIFWVQPMNALARGRLETLFEQRCDQAAVAATGQARPLAEVLLAAARESGASGALAGGLPMARAGSDLGDRIRRLARGTEGPEEPAARWPALVVAGGALLVMACAGPHVEAGSAANASEPASPRLAEEPIRTAGPDTSLQRGQPAPSDSLARLRWEIRHLQAGLQAMMDSLQTLIRERQRQMLALQAEQLPAQDSLRSALLDSAGRDQDQLQRRLEQFMRERQEQLQRQREELRRQLRRRQERLEHRREEFLDTLSAPSSSRGPDTLTGEQETYRLAVQKAVITIDNRRMETGLGAAADGFLYLYLRPYGLFVFSDRPFPGSSPRGRWTALAVAFSADTLNVRIESQGDRPITRIRDVHPGPYESRPVFVYHDPDFEVSSMAIAQRSDEPIDRLIGGADEGENIYDLVPDLRR